MSLRASAMAFALGAFAFSGCGPSDEVAKLAKIGDVRELRKILRLREARHGEAASTN